MCHDIGSQSRCSHIPNNHFSLALCAIILALSPGFAIVLIFLLSYEYSSACCYICSQSKSCHIPTLILSFQYNSLCQSKRSHIYNLSHYHICLALCAVTLAPNPEFDILQIYIIIILVQHSVLVKGKPFLNLNHYHISITLCAITLALLQGQPYF